MDDPFLRSAIGVGRLFADTGSGLKLFQPLDWLLVCGSMSCQMAVMRLLRMRDLHRRRALMRGAACLHFATRGLYLDSAFTVEGVIRSLDNPNHRAVLVSVATFCRFFAALAQRRVADRICFGVPACT